MTDYQSGKGIDYSKILSKRVLGLKPSGIRKFFDIAAEMKDVISLSIGEPDFKTPWAIRGAGIKSLNDGHTWYTANAGMLELREEIAKYYKRKYNVPYNYKTETIVTVGGSEAIDLCMRAILDPGDEVLIPTPSFVAYPAIATLTGATVVPIATKAEDSFRLTPEALKQAITARTKLLVMPYPCNPTGAVMRREHLKDIADVLRDTNIMVLSDEIYSELTYGGKHVSIAEFDGMWERTLIVNGFSKAYAMTGWRLGYALAPAPLLTEILKIHQYAIMSSPTTSQYAAIEALKNCDDEIEQMASEYDMRRRLCVDGFNKLGLACFEPEGAFYVFPSIQSTGLTSEEFCEKLLRAESVAVIPGTAFGDSGEGYVRVSYSYSINHITEALKRIEKFISAL